MIRPLLARFAAGTLGLALLVLVATGGSRAAHADGITLTPTTPTTVSPAPIPNKPDLVVGFENVSCAYYPEGCLRLLLKVRVTNKTNVPAQENFYTDVKVDGVMADGAPHLTVGPLFISQVFHFNLPATPGLRVITALTDSTGKVAEWNESNNAALTRVMCP